MVLFPLKKVMKLLPPPGLPVLPTFKANTSGLVSVESLVLATTKHAGHRIAIGSGIYAEVTLLFERGRYAPLPWTYADYRTEEVQSFLLAIRGELLARRSAS